MGAIGARGWASSPAQTGDASGAELRNHIGSETPGAPRDGRRLALSPPSLAPSSAPGKPLPRISPEPSGQGSLVTSGRSDSLIRPAARSCLAPSLEKTQPQARKCRNHPKLHEWHLARVNGGFLPRESHACDAPSGRLLADKRWQADSVDREAGKPRAQHRPRISRLPAAGDIEYGRTGAAGPREAVDGLPTRPPPRSRPSHAAGSSTTRPRKPSSDRATPPEVPVIFSGRSVVPSVGCLGVVGTSNSGTRLSRGSAVAFSSPRVVATRDQITYSDRNPY